MFSDGSYDAEVLILGASFAGIEVLLQLLRRSAQRPMRIVVVDRQPTHGYLPLVHERLLGTLPPADSELSTAAFCRSNPGVEFVQGEVVGFEPDTKIATLADGRKLRGRAVVVALGSVVAPPATLPGSQHLLRYKFRDEFERLAAALAQLRARPVPGRVVVVGGGISGVELAAELTTLGGSPKGFEVTLIGGRRPLLATHSRRVQVRVAKALEDLGVEIRSPAHVLSADSDGLTIEETLGAGPPQTVHVQCDLAVWAGGLRPPAVLQALGLPVTSDGWLVVGPTLQCFPGRGAPHGDIFACGDAVRVKGGAGIWPTMQRAIECLWQAKVVAHNVERALQSGQGQDLPALRPHVLRETFFYGISLGPRSLVVYRHFVFEIDRLNRWFRRWLMRRYFARYAPVGAAALRSPPSTSVAAPEHRPKSGPRDRGAP